MISSGVEDTDTQHSTGYTCTACGGVAVAGIGGSYLRTSRAIEALTVAIEHREQETATVGV